RAAPRSQRFQTSRKLLELRQRRLRRDLQKTRSGGIRTPDLPPMRRKLARDIPHLLFGREDLDVDDRFENYRPRLGKRVEERLATRRHEGDVLRIDRMTLAVINRDAHVLQREPG